MAAPDPTSRYAGLPDVRVVAPDGSTRVLGAPRVVPAPPLRGSYTIRAGDRLDLLAHSPPATRRAGGCSPTPTPWPTRPGSRSPAETIDLPDA